MKLLPFSLTSFFLGLVALSLGQSLVAQSPSVIYFEELTERIEVKSDTLYVVNFWATWCRPCVAELPYFDAAQAAYADRKVKVLLVSLDFKEDLDTKVVPFLKRRPAQSEVLLLDEPKYHTWMDKVADEWTGAIPATVFVKKSADIRVFHEGDFTQEALFEEIESLINE